MSSPSDHVAPSIRVRGPATDVEATAALLALLAARPQIPTTPGTAHPPEWSAPTRLHRRPLPTFGWLRGRHDF